MRIHSIYYIQRTMQQTRYIKKNNSLEITRTARSPRIRNALSIAVVFFQETRVDAVATSLVNYSIQYINSHLKRNSVSGL